jgi:hypothetical protein
MKNKWYVVLSPGRTGSNLLASMIAYLVFNDNQAIQSNWDPTSTTKDEFLKSIGNVKVIHTHSKNFVEELGLSTNDIVLILSNRLDIFASIMSHCIASITNCWHESTDSSYTNPINIPLDIFTGYVNYHINFYENFDISAFKDVYSFDYEDVVELGLDFVSRCMNIVNKSNRQFIGPVANKVSYKELIPDWEKFYKVYTECMIIYDRDGLTCANDFLDELTKKNISL